MLIYRIEEEISSSTAYIDMVRNHRERAFDEGMEAVLDVFLDAFKKDNISSISLPDNPYEIKEKKKKKEKEDGWKKLDISLEDGP